MQKSSGYFKDEIIRGISFSLKHLQQLQAEATKHQIEGFGITKKNPHFQNLATYLDLCFSFGLSNPRKGYWEFAKQFAHKGTRDLIEKHGAAVNPNQKGHLWLFLSILENTLGSYLELFTGSKKLLAASYKKFALLRDEECCEVLKTLVRGLDALEFSLNIDDPYLGYENEAIRQPLKEDPALIPHKVLPDAEQWTSGNDDASACADGESETSNEDIAVHLKKGRRKQKKEGTSHVSDSLQAEEDNLSSVESIGLEDDHYIPESEDSTPITVNVVLPRDLRNSLSDPTFVKDETIYEKFLLAYNNDSRASTPEQDACQDKETPSEFLDTSGSGVGSKRNHPNLRPDLPKGRGNADVVKKLSEHVEDHESKTVEGVTPSDGVYKITYVSEEEAVEEEEGAEFIPTENENGERTRSVDSFDEFCRARTTQEQKACGMVWPEDGVDEAGDSEQEYERTQLQDSVTMQDGEDCALHERCLDKERTLELMALSPHDLPQNSIRRVMHARMDTSIGILLPTLPRRPSVKDAVKLAQDFSADQKTIVTLSLETFMKDGEQFGKLFHCFLGSLHGIHSEVSVVLSSQRVYILRPKGPDGSGFVTIYFFAFDSINKIQTGLNFQDVMIHLDEGVCHIWTCDEVTSRNLVSSLKSGIRCGRSKGAQEEPVGQDSHCALTLALKEFLLFVEGVKKVELMYFGVVKFWPLMDQTAERKVLKSGNLYRRQNYLGVVAVWERAFFSLRGHLLYEYTAKEGGQVKQVLNLRDKCGGCVRTKDKERQHVFRILGKDGMTSMADLAAHSEDEANDWIMSICLVMAQVRGGHDHKVDEGNESVIPCGLALTGTGVYTFQIQRQTRKLQLVAMASLADITRVCVDNEQRDFCALLIDNEDDQQQQQKSTWILQFHSELELGKFEQHLFACWHSIYQIPLQFVLLADGPLKQTIRRIIDMLDRDESVPDLDALRL